MFVVVFVYETFTATDDNLRWALGLETDRMVNVKFTKAMLDTEMTVVRNEFERGQNNPGSILRQRECTPTLRK